MILKIMMEILGENYLHKLCTEDDFQAFSRDLAKQECWQNIPALMVMDVVDVLTFGEKGWIQVQGKQNKSLFQDVSLTFN